MIITQDLEQKIQKLVESFDCELYDIAFLKENENHILRVSITKKPSLTLDMCQEVSQALSPLLDVELGDFEKYFLEVSSPGIERVLKSKKHYKDAIGELVKIKTIDKKEFKGKLLSCKNDEITLENGEKIALDSIKKGQTYFAW